MGLQDITQADKAHTKGKPKGRQIMSNRYQTFARYRPRTKDIGRRFSDEEFAQEFIEPIKTSIREERTPTTHNRRSHDMEGIFPGE